MPPQPAHSDLHSAQSVIFNGHVYKSLGSHDPHSTQVIDERCKLYNMDPAWHICSPTPDALHVCAAYPWAAGALVFADGSAHWTANGPNSTLRTLLVRCNTQWRSKLNVRLQVKE
jgi:hypothetical protein